MNEIISAISTVGFPICSFLISAWFINKQTERQLEREKAYDEREDKHWNELSNLTIAVNNNSQAINELVKQIGGVKND